MSEQQVFDREDLLKCGHGTMYGSDTPRLPLPNMLMMDRITHVSSEGGAHGKGEVIAELDIHPDLWFFKCHFEDDPVMPGTLGLDALWQVLGFYMGWSGHKGKGRALGVKNVKFTGQVLPTAKKVTIHIDIQRIWTSRLIMGVADGKVSVDGKDIYSAEQLRVGVFKDTASF